MKTDEKKPDRVRVAAEHLVGNLWFNLDAVSLVASKLQPDTFTSVVGGPPAQAYAEMCRLLRSPSEKLGAASLEANLRHDGFDFDWLDDLQARVAPEGVGTLLAYAGEINNAANLLRIRSAAAEGESAAREYDARAESVAAAMLSKLTAINASTADVEHISVTANAVREQIALMREGKFEWGDKTGFPSLDRVFRLVPGDLIVVGGRPSQGKSSLARQLLLNRAKRIVEAGDDGQVVLFTADDTAAKTVMAMASMESGVDLKRLRTREADDEEYNRLEHALRQIEALPIQIDDTPNPTVEQLYYRCAMLNAQKPVRLACMDYLELVSVPRSDGDLQKVEAAARGIKGIGIALGFPFVLLSQLRKEVDARRDRWPTAADTKYAGEAEADVMLLIMRPEHYISRGEEIDVDDENREGVALVNVAKNKSGDVGMVRMAFVKEQSRFYELQRVYLDEDGGE